MSRARTLSRSPSRRLSRLPALGGGGLQLLPGKENLVFLLRVVGGVLQPDSIGLSAAALWDALPATHRSICLVDENTLRSAEAIVTNIESSDYLNDGGELVGSEAKGYALYEDGTSEAVLRKAYRYFAVTYPEATYWEWSDGTNMEWSDGSPMESGS